MRELLIHADDAGQRLDRYLRKLLPGAALGQLYKLLRRGRIRVDGAKGKPDLRLAEGMTVRLDLPDDELTGLRRDPRAGGRAAGPRADGGGGRARRPSPAAGGPLTVVHEDGDLLVVDKPSGLPVHGGTRTADTLVARVQAWLRRHGKASGARTFEAAPAHRLDRETSGLVVFGISARGLRGLTAALREHDVEKVYVAIVAGVPEPRAGTVDEPLSVRDEGVFVDPGGKPARSRYRVRDVQGELARVELWPETGRKRQLRVHLAALGTPIVGDRRHGGPPAARLHLHAWRLRFRHPVTDVLLDLEAPPPACWRWPAPR